VEEAAREILDKLSLHYLQPKAFTVWKYLIVKGVNV
jgi:hypothetical protein